jgi:chromosome segregation protein
LYLKRIELRGFKSFAEKTIISFEQGVTCIVGPNGSGKSNITDAIRWVLGEQRVKTLRGSKMEDVIFSGTKHRKPLGLAEVKLVFDNAEQFFPLEYDEIEIERRVFRSGDSEYQINGMPCRLKDIREILMDTGIGREGYSIIGQGKIDEILSGGKDERRLLFEEAAGILKYKTRKNESERKLKTTEDNLSRIEDIISEIKDRVEPLRIESERATRFLSLSEQLKQIELQYFANRYITCEEELVKLLSQIEQMNDAQSVQEENYVSLKTRYDEKEQSLFEINRKLRQLESTYHEKNNLKSQTVGEKALIEEKIQNVNHNVKRLEEEIVEIKAEEASYIEQVASIDAVLLTLNKDLNDVTTALSEDEATLLSIQDEMVSLKSTNESELQEIYSNLNEIEVMKSSIATLKRANDSLGEKRIQLQEQIDIYKKAASENETQMTDTKAYLTEISKKIEMAQSDLSKAIAHDLYLNEQHEKSIKQYDRLEKQFNEDRTELKLLETLEAEYDGYDKGVKEILTNLPNAEGIHGIVASLISVPKRVETAIEVALGRSIQHIVCERDSDAKEAIDFLRKNQLGRVTFLPLNQVRGSGQQKDVLKEVVKEKGFIGVASDLIETPEVYTELVAYLLGRIMIVEDFETARRLLRVKNIKYKIITLQGDVLIPGGTITGGSFKSKMTNILGRRRRIETLKSQIETAKAKLKTYDQDIAQLVVSKEENQLQLKALRVEIDQLKLEEVKVSHLSQQQKQLVENATASCDKATKDLAVLTDEFNAHCVEINEKELRIVENEKNVALLEERVKDYKEHVVMFEERLQDVNERMTKKKIEMASIQQEYTFKEREKHRASDDLKTIAHKRETRERLLKEELDRKDLFYQKVDDIENSINTISKVIETIKESRSSLDEEKHTCDKSLKELTLSLSESSRQTEDLKAKMHQIDLKKVKFEVEKEAVVAELWDKYELSIGEAIREVPEEPVSGNIKTLKSEIKSLGSVNIAAIKEYEEVSERYVFLKSQEEDLLKATSQLRKIIKDLEKQMVIIFTEHFDYIGKQFKETFRMLFHGGDAELILSDETDVLNSDIEIIAQPPGKKLQSLNLLSGGEKALTAIALLFAILRTKPTPFCVLDEIEAALDDVNVYRFADFIKSYADKSQFVVITHRKGTMEVADTLYGVTMEEYGISKVLSVKLEEVAGAYEA